MIEERTYDDDILCDICCISDSNLWWSNQDYSSTDCHCRRDKLSNDTL